MNSSMPAESKQPAAHNAVFADFVREALMILLATMVALAWAWTSFVGMFDPDRAPQGYLVLALTGAGGLASYTLAQQRLKLAVTLKRQRSTGPDVGRSCATSPSRSSLR